MPIKTCAWVRARLPLLAGGDSLGLDRWVVEPHLLRCADCRERLETLRASQAVLSAASTVDPVARVGDDPADPSLSPPSLWPEFSRRLHQSNRPRVRTAWGLQHRHPWALPLAAGLAAGLLLCASLLTLGARRDPRIVELVNDYVPLDQLLSTSSSPPRLLKPEDPEQFEARRSRPRYQSDAAYRGSLATAVPEEPAPRSSSSNPTASPRPRVELTQ